MSSTRLLGELINVGRSAGRFRSLQTRNQIGNVFRLSTSLTTQQRTFWRISSGPNSETRSPLLISSSSSSFPKPYRWHSYRSFTTKPDPSKPEGGNPEDAGSKPNETPGDKKSVAEQEQERIEKERQEERAKDEEKRKKEKSSFGGRILPVVLLVACAAGGLYALVSTNTFQLPDAWKESINEFFGKWTDLEPKYPLLPPPGMGPSQIKYTIVVDGADLYAGERTGEGWRRIRRPRIHFFISSLFNSYETVIWHGESKDVAMQNYAFIEKLDPYHMCHHLFVDDCAVRKTKTVKDIALLGRDLRSTIVVTSKPEDYSAESQANIVAIKSWDPTDKGNTELADLALFFDMLAGGQPADVRDIIGRYKGVDLPTVFRPRRLKWEDAILKQVNQQQAPASTKGKLLSKIGF